MKTARTSISPVNQIAGALAATILVGCFQAALDQADTDAAPDIADTANGEGTATR